MNKKMLVVTIAIVIILGTSILFTSNYNKQDLANANSVNQYIIPSRSKPNNIKVVKNTVSLDLMLDNDEKEEVIGDRVENLEQKDLSEEVGDRGLLEIYEGILDSINISPYDYNHDVTEYLTGLNIAEDKANKSLEDIDKLRMDRIEEEKAYKAELERLFMEQVMKEIARREKERILTQNVVTAQGKGLSAMGLKDEMDLIGRSMASSTESNNKISETIYNLLPSYLGKPYIWGGDEHTQRGVGYDCSGFTLSILNKMGKPIPRVSAMQFRSGHFVSVNSLQVGDLVFFDTTKGFNAGVDKPTKVSHVGLYVGNGIMVHASSGSNRIRTENVFSDYFAPRYMGARRYLGT